MVAEYGLDVVHAYMGHVQENAAEAVGSVITALSDGQCDYELDNGARIRVKVTVDRASRTAVIDFTGTSPQLERQLQRAVERRDGRRPLRVPHARRQGHPAQRRLPEAAHGDHPAADDAVTGVPRRGRRGQRRDEPGGHRRHLRRAAHHGGRLGHDEQRDVRQRALPVLRDGRERLGSGRRLRRHGRGPDEDDELPPHRPRSPRMALPGPPRVLRDPARQRRPGPLARRQRRHPATPLPRAHDRHHPHQPPQDPRPRPQRRRPRRPRPPLDRTPRRHGHPDGGLRQQNPRPRRRLRHRNPRRRRIRSAIIPNGCWLHVCRALRLPERGRRIARARPAPRTAQPRATERSRSAHDADPRAPTGA